MQIATVALAFLVLLSGVIANKENSEIAEPETPELAETPVIPETTEIPEEPVMGDSSDGAYVYPNSTVLEKSETVIKLTSKDNTDDITDWYKSLFSNSFPSKSTIKTKTNGNVENVVSAANSSFKVEVKITKESSQNFAEIEIEVSN